MTDAPNIESEAQFNEYVARRAYEAIEGGIEELAYENSGAKATRWNGDLDRLEELLFDEVIHWEIDAYHELMYNYPAFFGQAIYHGGRTLEDYGDLDTWVSGYHNTHDVLRSLARAVVRFAVEEQVREQLAHRREYPDVYDLFDRRRVSPSEFEYRGYRFVNRADGELTAFNTDGVRVESYTPEAFRFNHQLPEREWFRSVDELIDEDPATLSEWLNG